MKSCTEILIIRIHNDNNKLSFYIYQHLVTNKTPPTSVFSFVCWGVGSSLVISRSVHMGQGQNQLSVSEFPLILLYVCLTCPQTVMLLACSAPVLRPHRAARGQRKVTAPSQGHINSQQPPWQQPASGGPSRCWLPLSLVPQQELWWTGFN